MLACFLFLFPTLYENTPKMCVPDVIENNVKVFNSMSRTNETRHIKWHETCKCKCRLDTSVYNANVKN